MTPLEEIENYLASGAVSAKDIQKLLNHKETVEKTNLQSKLECEEFEELVEEVKNIYYENQIKIVKNGIKYKLNCSVGFANKVYLGQLDDIVTKDRFLNRVLDDIDYFPEICTYHFNDLSEVKKEIKKIEKKIADFNKKVNCFAGKVGVVPSTIWDYFYDKGII